MKSIKQKTVVELVIKKSRFINILVPCSSTDQFDQIYDDIKHTYTGANHYCYAYIFGDHQEQQKYSDDGEPKSTAGMPMLEILKKYDVTNILAVTIRYFGGIKLGASGLIRAYAKSVGENIKDVTFTTKQSFTRIQITVPFDQIGHTEHFLRSNYTLLDTSYDTEVHYHLEIKSNDLENLHSTLQENTNGIAVIKEIKTVERYV